MRKGRPKAKKAGKMRKGGQSSSRDKPKAKQRRGQSGAQTATDESDSGTVSSSTSLSGTVSSTRGTARGRTRAGGRGNTYTRQAAHQQKEAAEEASQSDRPSHGTPFPIVMKEERTGSRKRDRSVTSNHAAESAHRQKRHSGDPNTDSDQSGKGKAKKSTSSSGPKISGGGSGFPRRYPDSSAVPIDSHFSGDGTVPESAIAVETVDGRVAFEAHQKNQSSSMRIALPSIRQGSRPPSSGL